MQNLFSISFAHEADCTCSNILRNKQASYLTVNKSTWRHKWGG